MKAAQVPRGGVDLVQLIVVVEAGHDESLTPRSNSKCVAVQSSGQAKSVWQAQHGGGGYPGRGSVRSWGCAEEEILWAGMDGVVQKPSYCSGLAQQRELLGARGDVTRVTWSKIQVGRREKRASSQSFLCWGQDRRSRARAKVREKWYKRW